jgi:Uma2 family endonuclease
MSAATRPEPVRRISPAEYLAAERLADHKSELVDGRLYAMAGASRFHNRVSANFLIVLGAALKGSPCQAFAHDLRIAVESTNAFFYPDVVVACGELKWADDRGDVLLNPTILVEVLSPSTEYHDSVRKFGHYQSIPTLREYLLVSQDEPAIIHYRRDPGADWRVKLVRGLDSMLELESIKQSLALADLYDRISFAGPEPELT